MSPADRTPRRDVYLMPGSLHCADVPTVISTILGSCIAVCLWDPIHHRGAMNHYVLPTRRGAGSDARYGDVAIAQLVDAMEALGSRAGGLVAKIFGGAAVLSAGPAHASVGEQNLDLALSALQARRIRVVGQRTGGIQGRLVRFVTDTGEAALRDVPIQPGKAVVDRYLRRQFL